jgi:predicted RNA-binding protein with PIN domain
MYATTFHGALNGNASTATSATNASKLTVHTTLTPETADGFLEKGVVKWACAGTEVVGNDGMIMSFGWSDAYGA